MLWKIMVACLKHLGAVTRLDGRLRSDHALNCEVRSFYGPCLRETVPRRSMLVVSRDRKFANPLEFLLPKCSIFPTLQQLVFMKSLS